MKMKKVWLCLLGALLLADCFASGIDDSNKLNRRAEQLQESNPDSAIYLAQLALTTIEQDDHLEKGNSYWNLAQAYLYKHDYHSALIYGLRGIELFQETDTTAIHQELLTTLAWTFYDMGNPTRAYPYHKKALVVAEKRNDIYNQIRYTNALGLDATSEKQHEKALKYFQDAKTLMLQHGSRFPHLEATIEVNMGIVYVELGKWELAEQHLLRALEVSEGRVSLLIECYTYMSKVKLTSGDTEAARDYLSKAETLTKQTSYSFVLLEFFKTKYQFEEQQGNYELAFKALDEYEKLYAKVHNRNIQSVMNYLLQVHEEKIKDSKLIIEKNKELRNKSITIGVFILMLSLLLVGILIYRNKVKNEKELLRQQLLEAQLEQTKQEKDELTYALDYKTKKLEELALSISERNEIVEAMRSQVKNTQSHEIKKGWKLLISLIQRSEGTKSFSEELVNDFMIRLNKAFPNLTDKDTSLIIDIRNNLTSKEIADKYHIEVKSVEMSRYRLRKKLGLTKSQQLKEFIMEI
ncbi:tetratricopeptide repeat protein [Limibacter armeniacum]|uniref:tetratricopeptide repeat protein n=1 Tax=Limibacter armeniacum TaxID=466084 RepID=UPI002FE56F6D